MSDATNDPVAELQAADSDTDHWFNGVPISPGRTLDAGVFGASLADLAINILRDGVNDEQHALDAITRGAVALIAGVEHSAVVVPAGGNKLRAKSVHGDLPPLLMGLQNELGQGPCLDAVSQKSQVLVCDLSADRRWPVWSAEATHLGVRSMLCTPLAADGTTLGSLSLACTQPNAFDAESVGLAAVFATHAAIALVGAIEVRQLKAMVSSRDLIGQAKGMLMERYKLSADKAFEVLVRHSQNSNIKLRDLCQQLVETGDLIR